MKTKRIILFFVLIIPLYFMGCDVVDENDRIIKMDEAIPLKNVLLADFTDQDCINCPNAAIEINELKERYGDALVVVSIHASTRNRPLVTAEGNVYDKHFKTNDTGHPAGVIDGKEISINYAQWGGLVLQRFNIESAINLQLSADYNIETKEINITAKVKGLKQFPKLNILLWAVESKVISWQKMLDNSTNPAYEHNHILRAAINGIWGEEFSLETEKELKNKYALDEKWNPENISIVGFVFDAATDEVFDIKEVHLKN